MNELLANEITNQYLFDRIQYDDNPSFNQYIDDLHELIVIEGSTFLPSRVLYEFEPETYRLSLQDYELQIIEDLKQEVISSFPTPVALSFHRFERGFENNLQRLHFLRDTWESLINILHALTIGEARMLELPLSNAGVKVKHLLSDRLGQRIITIRRIIDFSSKASLGMRVAEYLSRETLEAIADLNRTRNGFSHTGALSEAQAYQIISEVYGKVIELLKDLIFLADIGFHDYAGGGERASEIRCDSFSGHGTARTIVSLELPDKELIRLTPGLRQGRPFAIVDGALIDLAPFWICVLGSSGHSARMAYLKRRAITENGLEGFEFELSGEAEQIVVAAEEFKELVDDLEALVRAK